MQQMAGQLLLLARVQDEEMQMAEVSVGECLREAYESCEPVIEEKGMKVVSDGTDFSVQGVKELLVCLFRNLFENAIRAIYKIFVELQL